jgi:hypothetical protein
MLQLLVAMIRDSLRGLGADEKSVSPTSVIQIELFYAKILFTFYFLSLKADVNVSSNGIEQKTLNKTYFLLESCPATEKKHDPWIRKSGVR